MAELTTTTPAIRTKLQWPPVVGDRVYLFLSYVPAAVQTVSPGVGKEIQTMLSFGPISQSRSDQCP